MKAYGYIRVSSQAQVQGDGFRRQTQAINAYAKTNGVELVRIFREGGVSGTAEEHERPAFMEMMTAILSNGVRTVIVEGLDRLAREYRVQENLLVFMAAHGVALIAARTGENVTEALQADPMRKALVQVQGVFAELEKNTLVQKLRQAREQKRLVAGKCEGRKPASELRPELLAEVRRLRRAKPGQRRLTFAQIAERLNADGVVGMNGQTFTAPALQSLIYRQRQRKTSRPAG